MVQDLELKSRDSGTPPVPPRHPARLPSIGEATQQDTSFDPSDLGTSPVRSPNPRFSLPPTPRRSRTSEYSAVSSDNGPSSPLRARDSISESSLRDPSVRYSNSSYASSNASKSSVGWQNAQPFIATSHPSRRPSGSTKSTPASPEIRQQSQRHEHRRSSLLLPPAIGSEFGHELERTLSQAEIEKLYRSSTTASQRNTFEKEAFRNSAILCDV